MTQYIWQYSVSDLSSYMVDANACILIHIRFISTNKLMPETDLIISASMWFFPVYTLRIISIYVTREEKIIIIGTFEPCNVKITKYWQNCFGLVLGLSLHVAEPWFHFFFTAKIKVKIDWVLIKAKENSVVWSQSFRHWTPEVYVISWEAGSALSLLRVADEEQG